MITPMSPMSEVSWRKIIEALKNSVLPPRQQVAGTLFRNNSVEEMLEGACENGMKFELETGYDHDSEKFILTLKVKAPTEEDLMRSSNNE